MKSLKPKFIALAVAMAFATSGAVAELARTGPVDGGPGGNGFPKWYQDQNGLALDLCVARVPAELDGRCLILPADVPDPNVGESFPSNFSGEHFWYAADAGFPAMGPNGASSAVLVMAIEAAFATENPIPGDQQAFGRIRVRINDVPMTGTYRFIHPYGVETLQGVAGDRIFFTDDVGFGCPQGVFDCAMASRVGPFLEPVVGPGSTVRKAPYLPPEGGTYLSDGAVAEWVTGSPFGTNFFRIEGPLGSNLDGAGNDFIQTDQFTVVGRVHTDPLPSELKVDRATYTRNSTLGAKIDVMATAVPAIAAAAPVLDVGLYGLAEGDPIPPSTHYRMADNGQQHHGGQIFLLDPNAVPANVTVIDNSSTAQPRVTVKLADEINISRAEYDGSLKTLTIEAASGDQVAVPQLSANLSGYVAAPAFRPLVNGAVTVNDVLVPPPKATVISEWGGRSTIDVSVKPTNAPVATADGATVATPEDTAVEIDLTGTNFVESSLVITSPPSHGTVQILQDANGNNLSRVLYTPAPLYNGADSFSFTLSAPDGVASSPATVAIDVMPVNSAPTAVDDAAVATVFDSNGTPIDVTANDSDVEGTLARSSVTIATPSVLGATTAVDPVTGVVTYTANPATPVPTGGFVTDSFSYTVGDGELVSAPANVAVKVYSAEKLGISSAMYVNSFLVNGVTTRSWTVSGLSNIPAAGQTVEVRYGAASATVPFESLPLIGTTVANDDGSWRLQATGGNLPSGRVGCGCVSAQSTIGGFRYNFRATIR
jgi:hypothetical protein